MLTKCEECGDFIPDAGASGYWFEFDGEEVFICRECDLAEGKVEAWQVITR